MRIKLNESGSSYAQVGGATPKECMKYLADVEAAIWAGRTTRVIYIDSQPRFKREPGRWVRWVWDCTLVRLKLLPRRLRALVPGARARVRERYLRELIHLNPEFNS